ncbi:MAG: hypothetical protein CVU69_02635 [Deltaproteobacteria bacterium HGW-Deltaproteobacteria-4]|nr:MAG: hypothetical protein CVU69_02635 [Deltaproteobacteria bacterium HGW-Deltaproteobacteria-4]
MPLVSVVMSVYNGERYLREAVDSILRQTFTDFEFIIINDGSTDGTREILESYQDERIVLIHQENMGLTKSLNKGIALARGKYIARQDADDFSLPERFATQVSFLDRECDISMVGSAVQVVDKSGEVLTTFKNPTGSSEIKEILKKYNCFWHGSVMFRRECLTSVGCYNERFGTAQDYDLWLRYSEKLNLANLPEPFYAYRVSPEAITFKKIVSQHRLANLARRLARIRSVGGDEIAELEIYEKESLKPLSKTEKFEIIGNYKPWCRLLIKSGLLLDAKEMMSEVFRYHPSRIFRFAFSCAKNINSPQLLTRFIEHA